jgi:dTDP-4-dehydrorhamnose 3,5-epimerase
MQIDDTPLAGLKLITPARIADGRGFFSETYNARSLADHGLNYCFVQDNHSRSDVPGVVRGLHFQLPPRAQVKLVRVVRGSILDIAVDLRRNSPTYGRHAAFELSAENWRQLLIPEGFAHGFCTLTPQTEVLYKVTDFYSPEHDRGLMWNDPDLGIAWPVAADRAVLSERDRNHPPFANFVSPFE